MQEERSLTYEKISLIHLHLFQLLGILPYEYNGENKSDSFRSIARYFPGIYFHISSALYGSMYLGFGVRMMVFGQRLDVDYVCEVVIAQGLCLRYLILYFQRTKLLDLARLCRDLWSFLKKNEAEVVRVFEKKVFYLRKFFFWNIAVALTFYITTALFVRLPPLQANGTERKILPYKNLDQILHRFYVEVESEPWYLRVFIFQAIVASNVLVVYTGVETLCPFFIMMACGYLRIIQNRLLVMASIPDDDLGLSANNVANLEVGKLPVNEVLNCIKFHQKTIEFCEKIENLTRSLFLVQVFCTVYNMCFIGIKLLENDHNQLKYASIMLLNLLQFFTCQWIAQYLLNESEAISNAAYFASMVHVEYEHEANHMLRLMMLRAKRPMQMTAGGYIKLSLETFKQMFANAFSFFTVLRNFSA